MSSLCVEGAQRLTASVAAEALAEDSGCKSDPQHSIREVVCRNRIRRQACPWSARENQPSDRDIASRLIDVGRAERGMVKPRSSVTRKGKGLSPRILQLFVLAVLFGTFVDTGTRKTANVSNGSACSCWRLSYLSPLKCASAFRTLANVQNQLTRLSRAPRGPTALSWIRLLAGTNATHNDFVKPG